MGEGGKLMLQFSGKQYFPFNRKPKTIEDWNSILECAVDSWSISRGHQLDFDRLGAPVVIRRHVARLCEERFRRIKRIEARISKLESTK